MTTIAQILPNIAVPPIPNNRVVALVYDGLCTFEFGIVAEIFGLARPEMGPNWYRFATAAVEPGPLRAHGGLTVSCDGGMELLGQRRGLLAYVSNHKTMGIPILYPFANRLSANGYGVDGGAVTLTPGVGGVRSDEHGLVIHGVLAAYPGWLVKQPADNRVTADLDYGGQPPFVGSRYIDLGVLGSNGRFVG